MEKGEQLLVSQIQIRSTIEIYFLSFPKQDRKKLIEGYLMSLSFVTRSIRNWQHLFFENKDEERLFLAKFLQWNFHV